jgi:hypothetical protein
MNFRKSLLCFTTRQLLPGSQRVSVPPYLVILWMLRTTPTSSPNCWNLGVATFCLDIVYRKKRLGGVLF